MSDAESFFKRESPLDRYGLGKSAAAAAATDVAKAEATADATEAEKGEPRQPEEEEKLIGSVGGRWSPGTAAEVDTHKPAVSTWGVFERPKDISR
ncbi:unnamed protein product [Phaeothamnion confervicola]